MDFLHGDNTLVAIQRFSDIGITAGGDPLTNATALRAWAGEGKAIMIDASTAPYDFATGGVPINLAFPKLTIIAEAPNQATLRHVSGGGVFLNFDGHATYPNRDAVKRLYFGEPGNPIMVRGAVGAGTTDLVNIGKLFDCHFEMRLKDADVLCRVNGYGQPSGPIGMVECTLNITSGPGQDDEPSVVGSRIILAATYCYSVGMRLHIEGNGWVGNTPVPNSQYATIIDQSNRNHIRAGSSHESNRTGGFWITAACEDNQIDATDNEANGAGFYDWVIRAKRTKLTNIAGKVELNGYKNLFDCCTFVNMVDNNLGQNYTNYFTACTWLAGGPSSYGKVW